MEYGHYVFAYVKWFLYLVAIITIATACNSSTSNTNTSSENIPVVTITQGTSVVSQTTPSLVITKTVDISVTKPSETQPFISILPVTTLVTKEISTPPAWEYLWLKGIPCSAPCWLGITPGQTLLDDAVKILKQNQFVKSETIKIGSNYIRWSWIEGTYEGVAIYNPNSNAHTIINMAAAGYNAKFKLGEIISIYGEPNFIKANYVGGIPSIHFFWFSKGFTIGLDGNQFEKPPEINSDLLLGGNSGGPKFFGVITLEQYLKQTSLNINANLFVPWQGYNDFYFYCREPDHFCKNQ
jgi:hypothetical protein